MDRGLTGREPTADDAARLMVGMLHARDLLPHAVAVRELERRFGDRFVYRNDAGNPAIARTVLNRFRQLTEGDVVWQGNAKLWRWKEAGDSAGRLADYRPWSREWDDSRPT